MEITVLVAKIYRQKPSVGIHSWVFGGVMRTQREEDVLIEARRCRSRGWGKSV